MNDMYVWLGFVSSIILTVIGITIFVVIIYKYIKAKLQKPTIVAVLGILAIICVVNYRWTSMGLELGNKFKFYVQSVFRDKMLAELEGDSPIINSTTTATVDSAITVSEIEKLEGIGKPTPVPERTLKNLEDFVYYLDLTKTENQYSFDDWYYKGAGEYINGKYDEAIISFKKALETKPDDAAVAYTYNYRGAAYRELGMFKDALSDFGKAIEFNVPNHALPYLNKGIVLYDYTGNDEEAITNINKAIEIKPKFTLAYRILSEIHINEGDYENAKDISTKALSLPFKIEKEDEAILLYLKYIAMELLKEDTTECQIAFNEILKEEIAIRKGFAEKYKLYFTRKTIKKETRDFIKEKTESLLKKYLKK